MSASRSGSGIGSRKAGIPTAAIVVRHHKGKPFFEAMFRWAGRQVARRVGPAWVARPDSNDAKLNGKQRGGWVERKGRVPDGFYDLARANVKAAELVRLYLEELAESERQAEEERAKAVRPRTFRELAQDWRRWLVDVKRRKPSTLLGYDWMLAERGTAHKRGGGVTPGYIMAALGDRLAGDITTADVDALLATIAKTGATPRTVNKHKVMVRSIFNYGIRQTQANLTAGGMKVVDGSGIDYGLKVNPAKYATTYTEARAGALAYYRPEEVEALASALHDGYHRQAQEHHERQCSKSTSSACDCNPVYRVDDRAFEDRESAEVYLRAHRTEVERRADAEDAEAVRLSAYAGLRLGELLALRWSDVDWSGKALTISRSLSAGQEGSTKSGNVRRVPLPDQASAALTRIAQREEFTADDQLVVCSPSTGRHLDGSALRRRYKHAQAATGLAPLRWHDLRHTYGSLLAANPKIELVTIKSAMGHANIATTERYLHARPAHELAAAFTEAFRPSVTTVRGAAGSRSA